MQKSDFKNFVRNITKYCGSLAFWITKYILLTWTTISIVAKVTKLWRKHVKGMQTVDFRNIKRDHALRFYSNAYISALAF